MNYTKTSIICSHRVKSLRSLANISIEELSNKIHISYKVIWNCEYMFKIPCITDLLMIANYFSVSIDYILGRTDNPNINK